MNRTEHILNILHFIYVAAKSLKLYVYHVFKGGGKRVSFNDT